MNKVKFPLVGLALAVLVTACAPLKPGSDPIEVRAEQTVATASDTFDLVLKLEYDNVDLVRSNAPAVHKWCEYMRQPVMVNGQKFARDLAIIESANTVRRAYKINRSPENKANLLTGLATVEAALSQAQQHLTLIGSIKPVPMFPPPPNPPPSSQ